MTEDTYTISVVRQDFSNHLGEPPESDADLLASYLAQRTAIRVRETALDPDYVNRDGHLYVNSDATLEALRQRIAA